MRALIIPARLPLKSLNTSSAVLGLYAPAPPSIQFLRSIRVSSRVRVSTRGLRKLQFFESPQMGGEIGQAKMWGFCLGFFPLQLLLIYSLFFSFFLFLWGFLLVVAMWWSGVLRVVRLPPRKSASGSGWCWGSEDPITANGVGTGWFCLETGESDRGMGPRTSGWWPTPLLDMDLRDLEKIVN